MANNFFYLFKKLKYYYERGSLDEYVFSVKGLSKHKNQAFMDLYKLY